MATPVDVTVYFNFRSPYCYLASKTMFDLFDRFHARLVFKPLGGWDGRSAPDRVKRKITMVRQDVGRFARRLGIAFNPPPAATDPTRAGLISLRAEALGCLRPYIVETMRAEWAEGQDIGELDVLRTVCGRVGLPWEAAEAALADPQGAATLARNWQEAEARGVFGVPTFIVADEIFWGQDRLDFVAEHLRDLRLARL